MSIRWELPHSLDDLGDHRAQQSAQLIDQCGALGNQTLTNPMHAELGLLLGGFYRYKPNGGATNRFANGFGVVVVILATFAKGGR